MLDKPGLDHMVMVTAEKEDVRWLRLCLYSLSYVLCSPASFIFDIQILNLETKWGSLRTQDVKQMPGFTV